MALATLGQTARQLKVPAHWLKAQVDAGQIPAERIGRGLRFHVETVAAAIADRPDLEAARRAAAQQKAQAWARWKAKKRQRARELEVPSPVMTVDEVCEYLKFNKADLLGLMDTHALPFSHDGTRLRFPLARVRAWLGQFGK